MCTLALDIAMDVAKSAYSIYSHQQESKAVKFKNNLALKEAKIAEQNAGLIRQDAIDEARRLKLQSILNMGVDKSKFAASGISTSSDSAFNLYEDELQNAELASLNIFKSAKRQSDSYLHSADKIYNQFAVSEYKRKLANKDIWVDSVFNLYDDVTSSFEKSEKRKSSQS